MYNNLDKKFMTYFLASVPSIGSQTIRHIWENYEDVSEILEYDEVTLMYKCGLTSKQSTEFINRRNFLEEVYDEYETVMSSDVHFVLFDDDEFPQKLREIDSPPSFLFFKGSLPNHKKPSVAVIGSRAATTYGVSIAEYFAESLAMEGVEIISGLAIGIDAAAHRGALLSSNGKTYGVLGGGVNVLYPKDNYYLYQKMINDDRGGVISEVLPNTAALAKYFPMRNRIISGLADVVLVVEAREKSGSFITVEYALNQGKDVLAIPGRISDPMSRGTNLLISSGAKMAKSPEDVLEALNFAVCGKTQDFVKNVKLLDKDEKIVYSTLDSRPKHIDEIVGETNLGHKEVLEALVSMELNGIVTQVSSNYYGLA